MWLVQALRNQRYYLITDPFTFYEWKAYGVIPKDTPMYDNVPSLLATSKVICSIQCPMDLICKKNNKLFLTKDLSTTPKFEYGKAKTLNELLDEYKRMKELIENKIQILRDSVKINQYITLGEKPRLYKVKKIYDDKVIVYHYGLLDFIFEQIKKHIAVERKNTKQIKSIDMSELKRLENTFNSLDNGVSADSVKLDFLIRRSKIGYETKRQFTWEHVLCETDKEGALLLKKVHNIESKPFLKNIFLE